MVLYFVFYIDKDIVQVYNNKNITLFCHNLINILLKYGQYINQSKLY